MTAIEEELAAFIAREIEKPFEWGTTDCAATADRWATIMLGWSPLRRYGKQHIGEAEARAWLSQPGGIAVAVNRVMRSSGLAKVKEAAVGDIGLVAHGMVNGLPRLCVAIKTPTVWFSRETDGLIGAPAGSVWKAWNVTDAWRT